MRKMKWKITSLVLTFVMVCSVIILAKPVKAADMMLKGSFESESGVTVKSGDGTVKGYIPEGETSFVVNLNLSKPKEVYFAPMIRYQDGDKEYNRSIADVKSTMTVYKDGKEYKCYQSLEGNNPFTKLDQKTATIQMENRISSMQAYYSFDQIFSAGQYQLIYSMPEQITKGAKVLLNYKLTDIADPDPEMDEKLMNSNTKSTAKNIKVPYDFDSYTNVGVLTSGGNENYWFKAVLPGKRKLFFDMSYVLYDKDKRIKIDIINASTGKTIKTYIAKDDEEENYGSNRVEGYYDKVSYWEDKGLLLNKGTYYVKISSDKKDTDASFLVDIMVGRAEAPNVTYWATGKKVIKGTCSEPGGRAYAYIKGKVYRSKNKIGKDGKFSIAIPNIKVGTKVGVYVIDAKGYYGNTKTIQVQSIPAPPKVTSYKRGSKTIKGTTFQQSTVTVVYQGKTYKVNTGKKKEFTITTDKALKKGSKFTIKVRRNSGNVSKTKTYTIK